MDGGSLTLRDADGRLGYVESLLEANDLPSADVRSKPGCFYVAHDGDGPVAVGGMEVHGAAGLLRSVAVERSARGEGVGTAVCARLESEARAEGLAALYLLTTTAAGFFEGIGYEEIERADAPEAIRRTTQFEDLCPSTATPMRKSL